MWTNSQLCLLDNFRSANFNPPKSQLHPFLWETIFTLQVLAEALRQPLSQSRPSPSSLLGPGSLRARRRRKPRASPPCRTTSCGAWRPLGERVLGSGSDAGLVFGAGRSFLRRRELWHQCCAVFLSNSCLFLGELKREPNVQPCDWLQVAQGLGMNLKGIPSKETMGDGL